MMNDILKYIPQRPPMVMVEEILHSDDASTRTKLTIHEDNMFVYDGKFSPSGLTENMAQTAAARAGYVFVENDLPVKLGFIGAVKNLRIYRRPEVGAILQTEVKELGTVMNISSVKIESKIEEELIAECEMKIFIQE